MLGRGPVTVERLAGAAGPRWRQREAAWHWHPAQRSTPLSFCRHPDLLLLLVSRSPELCQT